MVKKSDKPFMKYVVRCTGTLIHEGSFYLLECGHEEFRNGNRRPTRLLCKRCQWKAEEDKQQKEGKS